MINAAVGYIAKCNHVSDGHKPYMGRHCYVSAAVACFFTTQQFDFDFSVEQYDGSRIELPSETSMFLVIMNGRFLGGRVEASPVALLNDGLLDVTMQHGPAGTRELVGFFKTAMAQKGAHIYRDNYSCFRGRSIQITNKNLTTTARRIRGSSGDADHLGVEEV